MQEVYGQLSGEHPQAVKDAGRGGLQSTYNTGRALSCWGGPSELSRVEARGGAGLPLPGPDLGDGLSHGGGMTCMKRLSSPEDSLRRGTN